MLDLRGISTFTDFFVICSGTSEPQLKAIANEIETRLREDHSLRPVAIDGFPASQWMVLDYLQVVVHIFHRDKRAFYSLEDFMGRRAPHRMGNGSGTRMAANFYLPPRSARKLTPIEDNRRTSCQLGGRYRYNYFGDGLGGGVAFGAAGDPGLEP